VKRTVVLAAFALLVVAGTGSAGPGGVSPRRLADRHAAVSVVERRLEDLAREAALPAALARVRTYARYTQDQLADKDRGVDVEQVLAVVKDESLPLEVREEAANALITDVAKTYDPDLGTLGRGIRRPRAAFSRKVLALLVDKEAPTRQFAKTIIEGLWRGEAPRDPEIIMCKPRDRNTCTAARTAWERFLQR
jgi:hypothetical protein